MNFAAHGRRVGCPVLGVSSRLARLALPVAVIVLVVSGCTSHHTPRRGQPGRSGVAASAASRTLAPPTSTTLPVPAPAWRPDPAAVEIAKQYVTAALSYTWQQSPEAWIAAVAPICSPQWVTALRSNGDGGTGGWAAVVAGHDRATAHVLAVYPSAGPGPGRRLEVTAHITTSGLDGTSTTSAAMAVDLLPQPGGTWLVGWAG